MTETESGTLYVRMYEAQNKIQLDMAQDHNMLGRMQVMVDMSSE